MSLQYGIIDTLAKLFELVVIYIVGGDKNIITSALYYMV